MMPMQTEVPQQAAPVPTPAAPAAPAALGVFDFEEGLLGFPQARRYSLVPTGRTGLFWLQSVDDEALGFLLLDPFEYVDDYTLELGDGELRGLGGVQRDDLAVLAVVTLPHGNRTTATANLQGPVILDFRSGRARQAVLSHAPWGIQCPVDLRRPQRMAS